MKDVLKRLDALEKEAFFLSKASSGVMPVNSA